MKSLSLAREAEMLRVWKVLIWEYAALSIAAIAASIGIAVVGPYFAWALTGFADVASPEGTSHPFRFYFSYVGIAVVCFGGAAGTPIPEMLKSARLHPVSTRHLAAFLCLVPVCVIMLMNLVTQVVYVGIFANQWPISTTTVSIGAFSMLIIACGFSLTAFDWKKLVFASLIIVLWVSWFVSHFFADGRHKPITAWRQFDAIDLSVLGLTVTISWFVSLKGLSRFRCGDINSAWLTHRLEDRAYEIGFEDGSWSPNPLPDSRTALLDMEWCRNRYVVYSLSSIITVLLILLSFLAGRSDGNRMEGLLAFFVLSCVYAGLTLGGWLGGEVWASRSGNMKPLLSTLPFSDAKLGRIFVQSWFRAAVTTWCLIAAAFTVVLCGWVMFHGTSHAVEQISRLWIVQQLGWSAPVILSAGLFLMTWSLFGVAGTLLMTGRMWLVFGTFAGIPTIGVVLLLIHGYMGDFGQRLAMYLLLTITIVAVCGTTLWTYVRALTKRLLTEREVLIIAAVAVVLCWLTWVAVPSTVYWKTLWTVLVCLSLTPFATVPLALSWNRHR